MAAPLLVAKSGNTDLCLLPGAANRHGLITGATGTGKTVTLQTLAQAFSAIGVPVFLADVKGDLSGIAKAGGANAKVLERLQALKIKGAFSACPALFWDVYGKSGVPIRATVSDMGPLLLGRMLGLNETQAGVLGLVFKIADDSGMLLLDLKDLRSMLQFVGDNAAQFKTEYGNVSSASVGIIQRGLLTLEGQGAAQFFGEPMLEIADLMQVRDGHGVVSVLAADTLLNSPALYSTFLLWMLAELFEQLPEVGDPEKPKLVFFFDEAHLLFNEAPKALLDKVEQMVRLIRSKGVGVYFVTQNPLDIPESVLGQLGNRVQHALRAFTPKDQKAVKAAADTLRPNPKLKTGEVITELGVGEALVSFLDEKGRPSIVERAFIVPPGSQLGPLTDAERALAYQGSAAYSKYRNPVDRESAYEKIKGRTEEKLAPASPASTEAGKPASNPSNPVSDILFGRTGPRGGRQTQGMVEAVSKSAARAIGSELGRQIIRGVLGSILGGGKRPLTNSGYRAWGIAFALIGVLAFSFRPIWIKLAYAVPTLSGHAVSPVTLLFLRMMLSLPFFVAVAFWLRNSEPRLTARDWWAIAGLGFVGYYLASFLDFIGLQYVDVGIGRLILFLYPTMVLLLSFLFLRKAPGRREIAALVLSYSGIALVLSNRYGGNLGDRLALLGVLLIFASALCYAVYLVAGSQMVKRVGSMRFTAYTMIVATVPAVLQFFALEPLAALELPAAVWWYVLVMATFSTVLPVFLQSEALKRIGANHFALIGAAGPVTTALAGAIGLEEPLTALQAAGAVLVIFGVLLVSLKRS